MPLDISAVINGAGDRICQAPPIKGVISNPILTALIISVFTIILLFIIFDVPGSWQVAMRSGLYIFLGVTGLLFLHYHMSRRTLREEMTRNGFQKVVDSVHYSKNLDQEKYKVGQPGDGNINVQGACECDSKLDRFSLDEVIMPTLRGTLPSVPGVAEDISIQNQSS